MPEKPKPTPTTRARTVLTDPRLWSWVLGMTCATLFTYVVDGDAMDAYTFLIYGTGASLITVAAMRFR